MAPRLWALAVGLAVLLLGMFLVLEQVLPLAVVEPSSWLHQATGPVAVGVLALLASDVVLPVPSSLVMIASGAVFGPVIGAVLSTTGAMCSAMIGFAMGRVARGRTGEWIGPVATQRFSVFLGRHGFAAVVVTRPIPILAEVTAMMAGGGCMSVVRFSAASLLGTAATAIVYAAAGAWAVSGRAGWLALACVLGLAAASWWLGRQAQRGTPAGLDRPL